MDFEQFVTECFEKNKDEFTSIHEAYAKKEQQNKENSEKFEEL